MSVLEVRLDSTSDLVLLAELGATESPAAGHVFNYVFRGQSAKFRELIPRGDRPGAMSKDAAFALGFSWNRSDLRTVLRHYKRIIHNHLADLPRDDDWLEWMALIQHYGGPTRLLDVTESSVVGLYFAAREADEEFGSYLWLLHQDEDGLPSMLADCFEPFDKFGGLWYEPDDESWNWFHAAESVLHGFWDGTGVGRRILHYLLDSDDFGDFFDVPTFPSDEMTAMRNLRGVTITRPFRMNRRLLAQQGCFAVALHQKQSFMEQLVPDNAQRALLTALKSVNELRQLPTLAESQKSILENRPIVVRVWIPPELARTLPKTLRQLNVTGHSLFPDFEGFTQAMNEVQRHATFFGY